MMRCTQLLVAVLRFAMRSFQKPSQHPFSFISGECPFHRRSRFEVSLSQNHLSKIKYFYSWLSQNIEIIVTKIKALSTTLPPTTTTMDDLSV
jgi:hypothetical protein